MAWEWLLPAALLCFETVRTIRWYRELKRDRAAFDARMAELRKRISGCDK